MLSVIMPHLGTFGRARMKDFAQLLEGHLTRRQVRSAIERFVANQILVRQGEGSGTIYKIAEKYIENSELMAKAVRLGIEEMKRRGEIQ